MSQKAIRPVLVAGLALVLSAGVHAGAQRQPLGVVHTSSGSPKFACVDMARILRDWEEVKALSKRLTSHGCGYQERVDPQQEQIKLLSSKIAAERNPQDKEKLVVEKRRLLTTLQARFQSLKDELERNEKDQFDSLKQRIYEAIDAVAASRGLEMILEKQWVYYPRNNYDVTDEVLRLLRSKSTNK